MSFLDVLLMEAWMIGVPIAELCFDADKIGRASCRERV